MPQVKRDETELDTTEWYKVECQRRGELDNWVAASSTTYDLLGAAADEINAGMKNPIWRDWEFRIVRVVQTEYLVREVSREVVKK